MSNDPEYIRKRIQERRQKAAEVSAIVTREEVINGIKDLAIPLDFDRLVKDGILGKKSGAWYQLLDPTRLPRQASRRIIAFEVDSDQKVTRVRFARITKQLLRLADRLKQ